MVSPADVPAWVKFCSNTAPLAAIVVFTAPYPTLRQVQKDRSVGNLPLLPYSSMIANCFLWSVYGILVKESKIWLTNSVGLVFGLFYFLKFIEHTSPKSESLPGTVRQHLQGCFAIIAGSAVWVLLCYLTVWRKGMWMQYAAGLIGNTAVIFCMLMFASPLAAMRSVLRTRSARSIPLPFTLATILNCFLWSVAGLGEFHDFNVYFPNLLGLAFGLVQVGLKILFDYGSFVETIKSEDQMDLVA